MSVSYQAVGWNRTKKTYDGILTSGLPTERANAQDDMQQQKCRGSQPADQQGLRRRVGMNNRSDANEEPEVEQFGPEVLTATL
jgi:hypothetical protein